MEQIFKIFFQDICKRTSYKYHLILPPWNTSIITTLRLTTLFHSLSTAGQLTIPFPKPNLRTKKYCSFIYMIISQQSDS